MYKFKITIILFLYSNILLSEPFEGLTLITSMGGGQNNNNQPKKSILIDNDQNIINEWEHDTGPKSIAYLTRDSVLYVPCQISSDGDGQGGGSTGGRFKKMSWDGEIVWDYYLPEEICVPHHDIEVLPNGNILAICSETKSLNEALEAGIETIDGTMTLDMIVEIEPVGTNGANIVWRWHFWDHLVQDIDSSLNNFGSVSDSPQLLDINCSTNSGGGNGNQSGIRDWNHCNCISYNEILDQIVISSRHMNEFYVIDHSTTLEQAASHSGGNYGMGGDILYRWGNPSNYGRGEGSPQTLFAQHGVNWIPIGYPGEGNFILFNNNHVFQNNSSENFSAVLEIVPPINLDGSYFLASNEAFGPLSHTWIHQSDFYSNSQSGAFRLPNGNTLITSANQRSVFEVNNEGEVEWSYEGDLGSARALKYSYDYFSSFSLSGDLNSDETVDILDVVIMINLVLDYNFVSTADINNDGVVNILDVVQLVNIILSI